MSRYSLQIKTDISITKPCLAIMKKCLINVFGALVGQHWENTNVIKSAWLTKWVALNSFFS